MRKLIIAYIKFLFGSTNQHGVHSPFVYNLVTKCFYDKSHYPEYDKIQAYRKSLLLNNQTIDVTDLGVGSQVMKTSKRKVSDMAKKAGTTRKRAKLLYRLVKYLNCKNVLELGTSMGIGTYAMSLTGKNSKVISIEGCPNISNFTANQLKQNGIKNANLLVGDFKDVLKKMGTTKYDLLFIDGNHDEEATITYFNTLLPNVHNDSVMIFDDINWSKGMRNAWDHISTRPEVSVSIDTFFWGLVFFRKEQDKEHFVIRI